MFCYFGFKLEFKSKIDFNESFENFFGKGTTSNTFFEYVTGLRMTFTIMKSIDKSNQKILYDLLKGLYQSFVSTECNERRNVSSLNFYCEEELFNDIRTYLISLISDINSTNEIKEICIKLILLIGNIRGSGEDFLVTYNLINKHGYDFNIETELSQCKFIENYSHNLIEGKTDDRLKVSYEGSKSAHILKRGDININFSKQINLTFDSQFIYAYQEGHGLFKFGASDSPSSKLGKLICSNSRFSGECCSLMYLNGQLLCRYENSKGKPFALIDTKTLEKIKTNEEFNLKIQSLKEKSFKDIQEEKVVKEEKKEIQSEEDKKNEETHKLYEALNQAPLLGWTQNEKDDELIFKRNLCASPIITDGFDIYVISTIRKKITSKDPDEYSDGENKYEISNWNLEIYNGITWEFKKSIEIKIEKEQIDHNDQSFKTESFIYELREIFSRDDITECKFAIKGDKLLVGLKSSCHCYDLKTCKWTLGLDIPHCNWGYNPIADIFYEITDNKEIKTFKILGFKGSDARSRQSKMIPEYLKHKFKEIAKCQTAPNKIIKRTPSELIKDLMKNDDEQDPQEESKGTTFGLKEKSENSQFLILYILYEGSRELMAFEKCINSSDPVNEKKLELFRGNFSTSVTAKFFVELLDSIEGLVKLIFEKEKKSINMVEQYNFYMLLILFHTSIVCLKKLNIPLSSVLYRRNNFERLITIIEKNINVVVSKGIIDYTFEEGESHEELQCLWNAIESECKSIISNCLSLVYESLEDLMSKVTGLFEKMDEGASDNSLEIYINYLTLPEIMNEALKSSNMKDLIFTIYEKFCILKTKKLVLAIDSIKYETHQLNDVEYSSLEISNEGFIYTVTQNVINLYFEAYRDVEKQKEQSKADKDKLEILERKLERSELDLIKVFERISESTIQILEKCVTATQYYMNEAIKQQKEDDKIIEQDKKSKLTGKMKYVQFHRHLHKIAHLNNNFLRMMHVYVAAFASLKNSTSDKTLLLLSIKILKVIEIFIKLEEVVSDDLILSKSEDLLRNHLNEDIIKFFLWTTLKLVYSFFKIKNKVDLNKEVKINKKILDSKLLSGGIENRFLPILSKDAVNLLLDMCEITTDNTIKQYLQGETKEIDEDQVLMSIIHQGKDKDIDRVIDLLQINLERKHPWTKSAREEDMRLSRAAFACIIKFGKLYNDFTMMVDETGMKADSITIDDKNAVKIELAKVISKIDSYDTIFKHWESSAKMRSW